MIEGRTFAKYRLLARLGHGGMADVYLAVAEGPKGFNKLQVLKLLRPHLTEQRDFLTMFQDEGRLAARLNHPNVVQTNEFGIESGRYFIAMEYLDGQPLHRIVREAGDRLELRFLLHTLCEVLTALDYAHDLCDYNGEPLGVVHRDVTPHNVFVTYDGQVKLVDFGIAKTMTSAETRVGQLKGKIAYMAPEQAMRVRIDRRVDVFSVGVMAWEAVAGERMWRKHNEVQILHALTQGDLPHLLSVRPDADTELVQIIQRALAFEPTGRYATAGEFRQALEEYVERRGLRVLGRDWGAAVSELFEPQRAEIRDIIQQEMADAEQRRAETETVAVELPPPTVSFGTNEEPSASGSSSLHAPGMAAVQPSVAPTAATPSTTPPALDPAPGDANAAATASALAVVDVGTVLDPLDSSNTAVGNATLSTYPPRRSKTTVLLSVAALALAAGIGGLVMSLHSTPNAAEVVAASSTVAAASTARIEINVKPADAVILLDGKKVGSGSFARSFERDDKQHKLELLAEGYESYESMLTFDRDMSFTLKLAKRSEGEDAPTAEPATRKTSRPTRPRAAAKTVRTPPSKPTATTDDLPALPKVAPTKKKPALDGADPWE